MYIKKGGIMDSEQAKLIITEAKRSANPTLYLAAIFNYMRRIGQEPLFIILGDAIRADPELDFTMIIKCMNDTAEV